MFQRHLEKLISLNKENKDISRVMQTITDLSHDFIKYMDFYSLPSNLLDEILRNTQEPFTKVETVFILQNYSYVWRKKNDKLAGLINKFPKTVPGSAIADMIKDEASWVPEKYILPGEYAGGEKNSEYDLIKSKHIRQMAMLQDDYNRSIAGIQQVTEQIKVDYQNLSNAIAQLNAATNKELIIQNQAHINRINDYNELIAKLQERTDEIEHRINNPISEKEFKIQMNRLEASNNAIKTKLEFKIDKELDQIRDKIASTGYGKTSAEIKQEQEKEKREKEIRMKRGIPEEAARFDIPLKPVPIPVLHPSNESRKPCKIKTIFDAIHMHDFETLKKIVEEDPDSVYDTNDDDMTPLHCTVKLGLISYSRYLLEKGADVSAKDKFGNYAVHYAGYRTTPELIDLLYDFNTERGLKDANGRTPIQIMHQREDDRKLLMKSIEKDDVTTVSSILERWPDFANFNFGTGMKALHIAAGFGAIKVCEELLKWDADINAYDHKLATPLHYAAMYQQPNSMQFLLTHGADYKVKDIAGKSPFSYLKK